MITTKKIAQKRDIKQFLILLDSSNKKKKK